MVALDSTNAQCADVEAHYRPGMPGYVLRDWEVIDYQCFQLPGTSLWFRGPQPPNLAPAGYFTAIGAAQTFGCFCDDPYPAQLERRLGLPALNLGYSGAGPGFYQRQTELIRVINEGAFCIVQVMSGRSTSNALLDNPEGLAYGQRRSDGRPATADQVFGEAIRHELQRIPLLPRKAKAALYKFLPLSMPRIQRLVEESRQNWLDSYQALFAAIKVPTILFWFSERTPDYRLRYHSHGGLFGKYPQLIDAPMMQSIKPLANDYVECVSTCGMPQPLISRFTGEPATIALEDDKKSVAGTDAGVSLYRGAWRKNPYYPSPQMHEDAANALEEACRKILGNNQKTGSG